MHGAERALALPGAMVCKSHLDELPRIEKELSDLVGVQNATESYFQWKKALRAQGKREHGDGAKTLERALRNFLEAGEGFHGDEQLDLVVSRNPHDRSLGRGFQDPLASQRRPIGGALRDCLPR